MNNNPSKKLIRITTIPMALRYLLPGQMNFMSENGFEVIMVSADGKELPDIIKNEKCRHIVVPMTRKITPLQDLKCLYQLIKIIRKEKPDIVHSQTPKAGLLGMVAAWFCGVKVRVHTVGGLPLMVEKNLKLRLLTFIEKIIYASANQVWPNSDSLLQYIRKNKLAKPEKLKIIAKGSTNGVNIERFNSAKIDLQKLNNIKKEIEYDSKNTYLLYTGRLVKDKGIIELVNVFSSLQKKDTSLKLLLVGDFEETLDPLPASTIYEIKNNTGILHVSWTNDVEYFMNLANTFVFPSHREGFPNVLLQAGAMKLPIICSQIIGNIDIVNNGETGLIFETGNEQQMKNLILYAIKQKEKMTEMAGKLKDVIISNYQPVHIWQNILHQYSIIDIPKRSSKIRLQLLLSNFLSLGEHFLASSRLSHFDIKSDVYSKN